MIKEIIPSITPEHLLDIQVMKDAMDVFLDYVTEHSDITIDIKNIFDSKKVPIYEEFVKIYLNNIYKVLSKSEHNEALYIKLNNIYQAVGASIEDIDLSIDIVNLLKKDYILTNKDYKSSKGTSKGMKYIYNIIIKSGVQRDFLEDNIGGFRYLETGKLFEYKVEGTMVEEVFEHFVKPLVHPVGWAYFYQRVFYLGFVDYFNLEFLYTFRALEVRCMSGYVFTTDDYLTNLSSDGEQLVSDPKVEYISDESIGPKGDSIRTITVYFVNGEKLVSVEYPRSLKLYDVDGTILKNYDEVDGNCGLYSDYDLEYKTTTSDSVEFGWDIPFASTTGKLTAVGAGNIFIGAFVLGDKLTNKNVSTTYNTYVGAVTDLDYLSPRYDGSTQIGSSAISGPISEEFSIAGTKGATAIDEYQWEQVLVIEPNVLLAFEETLDYDQNFDDRKLHFDYFSFDGEYVNEDFYIESIRL